MAKEDYTGIPDQTPSLEAPDAFQRINANPGDFGAAVGEGLQSVGQDLTKASDFYGTVAASDATNGFLQTRSKILYGDPGKGVATDASGAPVLGPGGMPVYNGGFYGLRGAAAMEAAPQVSQQLQDAITEGSEGLHTPQSKAQFQTESRRYYAQTLNDVGQHTDQQAKVWAASTYDNQVAVHQGELAQNPTDPAVITRSTDATVQAMRNKAIINGDNPDGAERSAHQLSAETQVKALLLSNPTEAQKAFDANKGLLSTTPGYYALGQEVRAQVFNSTEAPAVNAKVSAALSAAQLAAHGSAAPGTGGTGAAPTGAIYDQIGQVAEANGATPAEQAFLKKEAFIESGGRTSAQNGESTGLFQFHAPTFAGLGGTDIHDTGQQVTKALQLARNNKTALTGAGVDLTDANLYIMHQQGSAGGIALLSAPPDTNVVTALTPAYMTGGRTQAQAEAIATRAVVGNRGDPAGTTGQFVNMWTQRWNGGSGGQGQYPSAADALRGMKPHLLDEARADAATMYPNDSEHQNRYVSDFDNRITQTISQQSEQYVVDAHVLQAVLSGPNAPINEDQLVASSPQAAAAWNSVKYNAPYLAAGIENRFAVNAARKPLTYGMGFKDYFDLAAAPANDPNRITNPLQFNPYVGAGENAPLTTTGADALSDLLAIRSTPGGDAAAAQVKNFIDMAHAELTFSNKTLGQQDPKGEAIFSKFSAYALPILTQAAKHGGLGPLLDPKSNTYMGSALGTFSRTPTEVMADRLKTTGSATDRIETENMTDSDKGVYLLRQAVQTGSLTPQQAAQIATDRGYAKAAPRAAPSAPATPAAKPAPPAAGAPPPNTPQNMFQ